MTEKNSNERKKLSLSLGGKLSLKNTVGTKLTGSVTTGARGNRNTVQVEVKRVKRNIKNNEQVFNSNNESIGSLSAEQISSRSKELKEGLARTAAEAEKKAIIKDEKDKVGEPRSDDLDNNLSSSPINANSLRQNDKSQKQQHFPSIKPIKREEVHKTTKKTFEKDKYIK